MSGNNQAISKKPYLLHSAATSILGGILMFFAKAEWRLYFEKTAVFLGLTFSRILMPLSLLTDVAKLGFAFQDLYNAKNRNLDKWSHFTVELAKLAIIGTAIFGSLGIIALAATAVPILFVTGLGLSTARNGISLIARTREWFAADRDLKNGVLNDPAVVAEHKAYVKKHALNFLLGTLITIGLGVMFLSGVGAAALFAATIATASVGLIGGLTASYLSYQSQKALLEQEAAKPMVTARSNSPLRVLINAPDVNNKSVLNFASSSDKNSYFYKKNRVKALKLLSPIQQKEYLRGEINAAVSSKNATKLIELINDDTKLSTSLKRDDFKDEFKSGFQSFFKEKTDFQDLYEGIVYFLENRQPLSPRVALQA